MSAETNKPPKPRDFILIALKILPLLLLALLLVSLLPDFFASSLTMLSVFVTGWISAAQRFFGAMTFSRSGVAWAIVMIVATLAGAHWFIRTTGRIENRWPLRATISVVALVFLALIAGMSIGATGHQLGWLIGSGEPKWQNNYRFAELRTLLWTSRHLASELYDAETHQAWREKWRDKWRTAHDDFVEDKLVVQLFGDEHAPPVTIALRPRNGEFFQYCGGVILERRDPPRPALRVDGSELSLADQRYAVSQLTAEQFEAGRALIKSRGQKATSPDAQP